MRDFISPEDHFYHQLRDIYTRQQRLIKALPRLTESSSNREPGNTFQDRLEGTGISGNLDELDASMGKHFSHQNLRVDPVNPRSLNMRSLKQTIKLVWNRWVMNL